MKEKAVQKLKSLKEEALKKQNSAVSIAMAELQKASTDENAAYDLYEKCVKKVNFEDKDKKGDEWRAWKAQQKADKAFRTALKYKYAWALLTLQAGSSPEDKFNAEAYKQKALTLLHSVTSDIPTLAKYMNILNEDALGGEFSCYGVSHIKPKGWPGNIYPATHIYEALVFPDIRMKKDFTKLRSEWQTLISITSKTQQALFKIKSDNLGAHQTAKEEENMLESKIEMNWAAEEDCYANGDQKQATINMMRLIEGAPSPKVQLARIDKLGHLLKESMAEQPAE